MGEGGEGGRSAAGDGGPDGLLHLHGASLGLYERGGGEAARGPGQVQGGGGWVWAGPGRRQWWPGEAVPGVSAVRRRGQDVRRAEVSGHRGVGGGSAEGGAESGAERVEEAVGGGGRAAPAVFPVRDGGVGGRSEQAGPASGSGEEAERGGASSDRSGGFGGVWTLRRDQ